MIASSDLVIDRPFWVVESDIRNLSQIPDPHSRYWLSLRGPAARYRADSTNPVIGINIIKVDIYVYRNKKRNFKWYIYVLNI